MKMLVAACLLLCSTNVFGLNFGPFSVNPEDLKLQLYIKKNPETAIRLMAGKLPGETIDPSRPIKFIVHGYTDDATKPWVHAIKNAYFKKGDYNVISVDWHKLCSLLILYPLAAKYTRDAGKLLGDLMIDLHQTANIPLENMHCIGHSLGAHVCGFAAKNVIKTEQKKIARITAMDAAGPVFNIVPAAERLNEDDADFVDAIHTDGGKYGYMDKIAKIDFFPNGGVAPQPGCFFFDISDYVSCSHVRAYYLLIESISSSEFIASECKNIKDYQRGKCKTNPTAVMGDNCNIKARGVYYLTTSRRSPYAKNGSI